MADVDGLDDDDIIADDDIVEVDTDDRDGQEPREEEEDEGMQLENGTSSDVDEGVSGGATGEREDADTSAVDDAVHVFSGHQDSVYAVACSPSPSNRVASGGGDEVAYLWSIGDAQDPITLRGHTDSVSSLAFSSDGALLASGGQDGAVCVWDASTGEQKAKLDGPAEAIEWCCWHPKGPVLLAGAEDFTAWMWNAHSAACMAVFTGHSASVTSGCFSPDGKSVLTGSADSTVRIWDPRSGTTLTTISGHGFHTGVITSMQVREEGGVGITGSGDNTAAIFSLHSGKVAGKLVGHEDSVECVGLHSRLPLAATGSSDSRLCLWDLNTLQLRSTCQHQEGVVQLHWHPTNPALLLTACADGSVHAWDARTGVDERTLLGHSDSLLCLALTVDGQYAVSGSDDHTCRVFAL